MNKKTRKLLTWCLVVAMVVTQMLFTNIAFASTRTAGNDRYMTAISISQANFTKADTVVLATGDDFADALAAAPLAYAKKGPLLLTASGSLSDGVLAEIQRLGAKNVIIVGGTKAVSESVASALSGAGLTVSRLSGADRYATSVAIANAEGTVSGVVVANGNTFADALSISSIAAFKGMAILLTDGNSLTSDQAAFVSGKTAYAVGGSAVVSDALVNAAKATRLAGDDRYSTNVAVASQFAGDLSFATVYVATGEDFADALAGAVAAANSKSVIILVGSSLTDGQSAFLKGKMTKDSKVNVLGGVNAVSDSVASAIDGVTGTPAPAGGPVSVTSVKAIAADTMEVDFSAVPADTSKVVFTVQRETTPVTVTASWNGSVATLKYSSKFPQGSYSVNVKNDATDLGTTNVTIDQEKVAKIDVTTDKFAVSSEGKKGYFTYKVENQYGEDITNKNLASINWTVPGVGPGDAVDGTDVKGVITATVPNNNQFNFLNLSSITITGVDTSANVVVTKTLSVNASVGTLSSIKLLDVTNVDNKALQAGDTASKWNITYEATDLSGNKTSFFTLLNGGLVDQDNDSTNDTIVLSTSGYIKAQVKNNSGIGVMELTVDPSADQLTSDVPVTVTAITKNGSTSTLNLTLKKKSNPSTFTLMAPTEDVSYGEAKEVPFVSYDADGVQLTTYDDVVTNPASVTLSPASPDNGVSAGLYFTKKANGDAKLMYKAPALANPPQTQDQSMTLSATTNTGKFSSVTINVRKASKASTLTVNTSSIVPRIADGGYIRLDKGFFTVKDQYGRVMPLAQGAPGAGLYVKADVANGSVITVTSANTNNDNKIVLQGASANNGGTSTVKFSLMDGANVVATQSVDFTAVKLGDIKGLKMISGADGATLYDVAGAATNNVYQQKYKVYGVDGNGNLVILPAGQISSAEASTMITKSNNYLSTAKAFDKNIGDGAVANSDDYNKILVQADATDLQNADQSTVVTVSTLIGNDVRSTSFTLKISDDNAVAKSISAPDEIDITKFATGDKLKDAITVLDQYGKDMAERNDGSITCYANLNGGAMVQMPTNFANNATLGAIKAQGITAITVVDNAGHSVSINLK